MYAINTHTHTIYMYIYTCTYNVGHISIYIYYPSRVGVITMSEGCNIDTMYNI